MCNKLRDTPICEYKSTRFIRVRNPKLVITYYTTIFLVLLYIIFFLIVSQKGYQQFDNVVGTTSVKLKGTGSIPTNTTNQPPDVTVFDNMVLFDAIDLVVPPMEENAFFITTAMIVTPNQERGFCSADTKNLPVCTVDADCVRDQYNDQSQGIITGACNTTYGHCQIYGWCPLESDHSQTVVANIGNFTAMVKIDIAFPLFDVTRTNMIDKNDNMAPIMGYNLWTINDMLRKATSGQVPYVDDDIANSGAIILMSSKWNCNLDDSKSSCNPHYQFERIDEEPDTISVGYNFRRVEYNAQMNQRTLTKLIGIRVVFVAEGIGGQFHFATLAVTFGAGMAYLGVASFLTDVVLEKFLPQSKKYFQEKSKLLDDDSSVVDSTVGYAPFAQQSGPGANHQG